MAFQRKGVVILATDGPDVADPLGRLALRGDLEPITDQRPERFAMNGAIAAHRHTAHALGPAGDNAIARPRHELSNRDVNGSLPGTAVTVERSAGDQSEVRRVGTECASTCSARCMGTLNKKKKNLYD